MRRFRLTVLVHTIMNGSFWEYVGEFRTLDECEFFIFTDARIQDFKIFDIQTGAYIIE